MAEYGALATMIPGFAVLAGFLIVALIIGLVIYVFSAIALMTVAKKLNYKYPGLMWIPFVNIALIFHFAKFPWWLVFAYALAWIPVLGQIIQLGLLVIVIISYYRICETLKRPGWWGILIGLVPIVGLVFLGMLAWGKD